MAVPTHDVDCDTLQQTFAAHNARPPSDQSISTTHDIALNWRWVALIAWLLVSAYLTASGLAGMHRSEVGWISLLPLFFAIRWLRPFPAGLCGGLWGISLFGLSTTLLATGITPSITSALLLATAPCLYAYLGARYTRWNGFDPLALGVGWIAVEVAVLPLGLGRGLLSGSLTDDALFSIVGHLFGYVFVGFIVAYISALIVTALTDLRIRVPSARRILAACERVTRLTPQTFGCLTAFTLRPSRPRAPPT